MNESIVITGANAGLGKEAARQLALKNETKKVILLCRNQVRAEAAKKDLEERTGRKIFEIIIGDVADADSVRKAAEKITEPIDAVILNAGGMVGKTAGKITRSGMNELAWELKIDPVQLRVLNEPKIDESGNPADWGEHVTDEEYAAISRA